MKRRRIAKKKAAAASCASNINNEQLAADLMIYANYLEDDDHIYVAALMREAASRLSPSPPAREVQQ